ncbi:MAG TPA: hypothetical protein VGL71_02100, partial [Urbifossiella sp.]
RTVRLFSNGSSSRRVHSVRSLQPDRFSAKLLSFEKADSSVGLDRLVAVVEVSAKTDRPGSLEGFLEVVLNEESRASDKIAVLGDVVPPIRAWPSTLVLPKSAGGEFVYSDRVVLTSRDGLEFDLKIEEIPNGVAATIQKDPSNPGQWLLNVRASAEGGESRKAIVRARAEFRNGGFHSLELPVAILAGDP